jgi:hypothetical protein
MSPFRWDVLAVAFVLAVPLLALGLRGDLSGQEVMTRLPWCLAAGWAAVALLHWAFQPRGVTAANVDEAAHEPLPESEPSPTL